MDQIKPPEAHSKDDFKSFHAHEIAQSSNFINSIVVPRPIAFITSRSSEKIVNAAPFSYFNLVCHCPPIISVGIQRRKGELKDTARNILTSEEFVVNICSLELVKEVSIASGDFPRNVSEIDLTHLTLLDSDTISVPRIANALIQMECKLDQAIHVRKDVADLILGEVLKVHVHKDVLNDEGYVDLLKLNPLGRVAGIAYVRVEPFCEMPRGL